MPRPSHRSVAVGGGIALEVFGVVTRLLLDSLEDRPGRLEMRAVLDEHGHGLAVEAGEGAATSGTEYVGGSGGDALGFELREQSHRDDGGQDGAKLCSCSFGGEVTHMYYLPPLSHGGYCFTDAALPPPQPSIPPRPPPVSPPSPPPPSPPPSRVVTPEESLQLAHDEASENNELVLELPLPRHESIPRDHDVEAQESSEEQGEVIINIHEEDDPCVIRNAF